MQYAVIHADKKTTTGKLGNHIDRNPDNAHSYRTADPNRLHLNQDFTPDKFRKLSLEESIKLRIAEGRKDTSTIRKDAVRAVTWILSGSHEKMTEIFRDPLRSKSWIDANRKFMATEFGEENIVRFTLHLDEKTPHIHAVIVPINRQGKLNAKSLMGGPSEMVDRQSRYAEAMKGFGLERGVINSKAKHESDGWYEGKQRVAVAEVQETLKSIEKKNVFQIEALKKEASDTIIGLVRQNADLKLKLDNSHFQVEQSIDNQKDIQKKAETKINHLEKLLENMTIKAKNWMTRFNTLFEWFEGEKHSDKRKEIIQNGYMDKDNLVWRVKYESENTPIRAEEKEEKKELQSKGLKR